MPSLQLPRQEDSYWISSASDPGYPALEKDLTVDVVVVGAGIAGLSTAYFLKQAGYTVAVVDQQRIGTKVTGHTTGKVTSQHNLCYTRLVHHFGVKKARLYGETNEAAILQMETIIKKEKISCDWQRDDSYVFTTKPEEVARLQKEVRIAQELGLPASFETTSDLPFQIQGAVRFANQAKFHARKYLLGLARAVNGKGSYIFEQTRALAVHDGKPCSVSIAKGILTAKFVVVATNVPSPLLAHTSTVPTNIH